MKIKEIIRKYLYLLLRKKETLVLGEVSNEFLKAMFQKAVQMYQNVKIFDDHVVNKNDLDKCVKLFENIAKSEEKNIESLNYLFLIYQMKWRIAIYEDEEIRGNFDPRIIPDVSYLGRVNDEINFLCNDLKFFYSKLIYYFLELKKHETYLNSHDIFLPSEKYFKDLRSYFDNRKNKTQKLLDYKKLYTPECILDIKAPKPH